MPPTSNQAGGRPGLIIQDHQLAGGKRFSASQSLANRSDNGAALRALLHQIDLDEQLRRRAVQQAILTATAAWWRRRALDFEWARPRPSDFRGRASRAELAEADLRCRDTAEACRIRASLIDWEAADDD